MSEIIDSRKSNKAINKQIRAARNAIVHEGTIGGETASHKKANNFIRQAVIKGSTVIVASDKMVKDAQDKAREQAAQQANNSQGAGKHELNPIYGIEE